MNTIVLVAATLVIGFAAYRLKSLKGWRRSGRTSD